MLPIVREYATYLHQLDSTIEFRVDGGGSVSGLEALVNRETDIAASSIKAGEEVRQAIAMRGEELVEIAVGYDAIVIIANETNPVESISLIELQKVYEEEIQFWNELGGSAQRITTLSRDANSGTFRIFSEKVLNGDSLSRSTLIAADNREMMDMISMNPLAIGFMGVGDIRGSMKILNIRQDSTQIVPGEESILGQDYPLMRNLYFYYLRHNEAKIRSLLEFSATETGQEVIAKHGFVPISRQ